MSGASEQTSEWPCTYVSILVCSRPQCNSVPASKSITSSAFTDTTLKDDGRERRRAGGQKNDGRLVRTRPKVNGHARRCNCGRCEGQAEVRKWQTKAEIEEEEAIEKRQQQQQQHQNRHLQPQQQVVDEIRYVMQMPIPKRLVKKRGVICEAFSKAENLVIKSKKSGKSASAMVEELEREMEADYGWEEEDEEIEEEVEERERDIRAGSGWKNGRNGMREQENEISGWGGEGEKEIKEGEMKAGRREEIECLLAEASQSVLADVSRDVSLEEGSENLRKKCRLVEWMSSKNKSQNAKIREKKLPLRNGAFSTAASTKIDITVEGQSHIRYVDDTPENRPEMKKKMLKPAEEKEEIFPLLLTRISFPASAVDPNVLKDLFHDGPTNALWDKTRSF